MRLMPLTGPHWRVTTNRLLLLVFGLTLLWVTPAPASEVRRFLLLVDYIGSDYSVAVRDGKVVVPEEYQEMLAFTTDALALYTSLPAPSRPQDSVPIQQGLQRLKELIDGKGDPAEVASLSKQIKDRTVSLYGVTTFPLQSPSGERGNKLYQETCATCHGANGKADTAEARKLKPPPSKFNNASVMDGLSPFKAFNVLSFGITGTGMASFDAFSEQDRWHLAFYVFSLRFSTAEVEAGKSLWNPLLKQELGDLRTLAFLTDGELSARLADKGMVKPDEQKAILAYLRSDFAGQAGFDPLPYALVMVEQSLTLVKEGKANEAYATVLEGYLEGFELAEPQLQAVRPDRIQDIEKLFLATRRTLKAADLTQSSVLLNKLRDELLTVQAELAEGPSSPYFVFLNSMTIILREGLEAALIVAAILAFLRSSGQHGAAYYVHLGWIGAMVATLISWFIAAFLIKVSGSNRELIEGIASLLAAFVLFYVSYWLLAKLEAQRWMDFIKTKIEAALSTGHVMALAGVAFLAVYREGLETVLFYQALLLQGAASPSYVLLGFFLGLGLLTLVILAIFKAGLKIPLRYFFGLTSGLLYILATIFAGEGIYRLQQVDLLSKTPLNFTPVPTLGIYPNAEGFLIQVGMLVLFLGSLLWFFVLAPKKALSHSGS
jgi:high-affinity iron transporter